VGGAERKEVEGKGRKEGREGVSHHHA
jgi:hypothetical protein